MRLPFIVSLVLLVSACATIRSNISVFHKLNPKVEGMKYAILPSEEQVESLEYKSYEKVVRQQLNAKGLKEVPFGEAEVIVFFSYGIDGGKEAVVAQKNQHTDCPQWLRTASTSSALDLSRPAT